MKQPILLAVIIIAGIHYSCSSQVNTKSNSKEKTNTPTVGGGCDGCDIMYINMPDTIQSVDSSAGWYEKGIKLVVIGRVVKKDGKTPAENVIIYYHQTDNNGLYSPIAGMDERAKRHGHIRGWMKTAVDGSFALYTIRPAPYPGTNNPAHIHIFIKEPGIANEYYIDEWVFDDDKLLTTQSRQQMENRGGNGILYPINDGSVQRATHTITLGLNIPGYPTE